MLRVAPVIADYLRLDRVFQGKLHPAESVSIARGGRQAADRQVWIEAPHLYFEHVKLSGYYLRMRAPFLDTERNYLPVGAVFVLQAYQYP
jgi:hypothetical protein